MYDTIVIYSRDKYTVFFSYLTREFIMGTSKDSEKTRKKLIEAAAAAAIAAAQMEEPEREPSK